MEYTEGQVVYSKCGHDKGGLFIILSVEGEYVYLADGKRRPLEKPKRKKIKHIQPTHYVDVHLQERLQNQTYLLDADIAKGLKKYLEKEGNP